MPPVDLEQLLDSLDSSRRTFLKSLILGTAYSVPMVTSFGMEGAAHGGEHKIAGLCSNLSTRDPDFNSTADVVVNKTSFPDPVGPGELLGLRLEVYNCGPAEAVNVVVTDQLPNGARFLSSTFVDSDGTSFEITEPPVGSEGGLWQAAALSSLGVEERAVFEIFLEVLP